VKAAQPDEGPPREPLVHERLVPTDLGPQVVGHRARRFARGAQPEEAVGEGGVDVLVEHRERVLGVEAPEAQVGLGLGREDERAAVERSLDRHAGGAQSGAQPRLLLGRPDEEAPLVVGEPLAEERDDGRVSLVEGLVREAEVIARPQGPEGRRPVRGRTGAHAAGRSLASPRGGSGALLFNQRLPRRSKRSERYASRCRRRARSNCASR
jgi:hypothetical protein